MPKSKLNILSVLFKLLRGGKQRNRFTSAKNIFEFKVDVKRFAIDVSLMSAGILSAGFGLKGFLLPNSFLDGGATGIALLVAELSGINLSILLVCVNLPFILLGYRVISKQFAIRTTLCIVGLALCVAFIRYPIITNDKLLVAVLAASSSEQEPA